MDRIVSEVAEFFAVSEKTLKGSSRLKSIILPRQIAMFLIKESTNHSLAEIGLFFDGKKHATVLHSTNKVSALVKRDREIRRCVEKLRKLLTKHA